MSSLDPTRSENKPYIHVPNDPVAATSDVGASSGHELAVLPALVVEAVPVKINLAEKLKAAASTCATKAGKACWIAIKYTGIGIGLLGLEVGKGLFELGKIFAKTAVAIAAGIAFVVGGLIAAVGVVSAACVGIVLSIPLGIAYIPKASLIVLQNSVVNEAFGSSYKDKNGEGSAFAEAWENSWAKPILEYSSLVTGGLFAVVAGGLFHAGETLLESVSDDFQKMAHENYNRFSLKEKVEYHAEKIMDKTQQIIEVNVGVSLIGSAMTGGFITAGGACGLALVEAVLGVIGYGLGACVYCSCKAFYEAGKSLHGSIIKRMD